jgi:glycosyltransferase involved in cell wall biosynthesis
MRILILNTLYAPHQVGGAERSTQLLAEGLKQESHRVAVACTSPEKDLEMRVVNRVPVYGLPLKNVYWPFDERKTPALKILWHALNTYNPWMQKALGRILDAERPDVLHTHNLGGFSATAWKAAASRGIPIVHTARDYSLLCPRNMFQRGENCQGQCWKCRPFAAPRRRLSRHVDAAVGISRFVLDRHRSFGYFPNARLRTVIHNPYTPPEEASDLPESSSPLLRFGFLGRLSPMKGIEHLLKTVDTFEHPPEVYIGGTGEEAYVNRLREAYEHSRIHFLGFVDPTNFFAEIDVLVVPSVWHEPFGRVVIEAYAHGTPVIAARRGGLPEIVEEGTTGWTFDPDDASSLRRCIEWVRDAPQQVVAAGEAARSRADDFRLDRHVQQYTSVYEAVQEHRAGQQADRERRPNLNPSS